MPKKITLEEFIKRCKVINPNLDYSLVIYKGSKEKIIIGCPKHGNVSIISGDFLRSGKCPKCSNKVPTNEEFIERCKKYYPEYDYSNTVYTNRDNPVEIKCLIHDHIWYPLALNLERGLAMCPLCRSSLLKDKYTFSQSEFLDKCNLVHNNKYDYSETIYSGMHNKISIKCNKHGIFQQLAGNHIRGMGCPKCKRSKGEEKVSKFLSENSIKFQELYVIPYELNHRIEIDFYLPELNTFIEYNGILHYIAIEKFGGQFRFELLQKRDLYLRDYCKNNNIKLLEIKYDENVNDVLLNLIIKNGN